MALDDAFKDQIDTAVANRAQLSQVPGSHEAVPTWPPHPRPAPQPEGHPWLGFWIVLAACATLTVLMAVALPKPARLALKILRWSLFALVWVCIVGAAMSARRGDIHYSIWIFTSAWPAFFALVGWTVFRLWRRRKTRMA